MSGALTLDDLVSIKEQWLLGSYLTVAGATVMVYDCLRSLDLEVEYIWKSNWSIIKVLYLWTRYQTFVELGLTMAYVEFQGGPEPRDCYSPTLAVFYLNGIGVGVSELVLIFRTWAMYNRSRAVGAFMLAVFAGCFSAAIVLTNRFLNAMQLFELPGFQGCLMLTTGSMLKLSWSMLLCAESICLFLALWKLYSIWRHVRNLSSLLQMILMDGIAYYVLLIAIVLLIICAGQSDSNFDLTLLVSVPGPMVHSVATSHLILHMRQLSALQTVVEPEIPATDSLVLTTVRQEEFV